MIKTSTKIIKELLESSAPEQTPEQIDQIPDTDDIANVAAIDDSIIRGEEDPIKGFIDKMIDTKNKILKQTANSEIEQAIN